MGFAINDPKKFGSVYSEPSIPLTILLLRSTVTIPNSSQWERCGDS